ncbi:MULTISPECIES: MFS transporter [Sporosarcina]|uniref:MFS transporter n=1 Tax=Sporosarcina TaxID=1569 RepID=UPI001E6547AB|nr:MULTISPECIES: MFS transporter [Sporosarcina]GKV66917.1 MFS transporter [Sporosarcina sp. NCCP-2331]GLB57212.1 MFS transporter [Sporosarcina sp. NCCP-2378]
MNRMLKPTIIAISMATVMAGAAISPALGLIASNFSDADPVMIKLILTAPSLFIIPFTFISSYLTSKISKRIIVLIGLSIYVIAGVGAQFTNTIEMLLAFRFILGAGVGLVMPLGITLISDHFNGREQVKLMGYNSAFSNFGGILTMMLAGYLASISWRAPFNVYLMGVVIFIMVYVFLPKDQPRKKEKDTPKLKLPLAIYGYALASAGIMLVYYSVATNMALYLEQSNIGGSELAGTVISFTTVGGMITSLTLIQLQDVLKSYIIPISLLVMGIAFTGLALSHSVPIILACTCMVGFGQGILFPIINVKALGLVNPLHSDKVIAAISSSIYVGQFSSPLVLDGIARLAGFPAIRFQYTVVGIGLGVAVVLMMLYRIIRRTKTSMEEA